MRFVVCSVNEPGLISLGGKTYTRGMAPPVTCMQVEVMSEAVYQLKEARETDDNAALLMLEDTTDQPRGLWFTPDQFERELPACLVRKGCAALGFDFMMLHGLPE